MIQRFEEFVGLISSIHKDIQKIKQNKMKEFGLSGNHVMCLFYLSQNPEGLTGTELCQLISVNKAAISRTLSNLVEKGYVFYPDAGESKKYRAVVKLTLKGIAVTKQIDDIIRDVVDEIGKDLNEDERETMYQTLAIVSRNLETLAKQE